MSGHSKWANIKHKKAVQDSKKAKVFTKLIKEITVAARAGGQIEANPRLRFLVEKARNVNMPADNVKRAIQRGTGELPGVHYEPQSYEGYGPYNVAIIVDTLTDNKNRTVGELRKMFSRANGNLGETGSVNWMFKHTGVVRAENTDTTKLTEDQLIEQLLDYNVTDIKSDGNNFMVTCEPKSLDEVKTGVAKTGLKIDSAELEWLAHTTVQLTEEQMEKVSEFLNSLEDHDDVQNLFTNIAE